jgi:hypothetical protein
VDQQEKSKKEGIRLLQIHSIGHGVITSYRSKAIKMPTRQKDYGKMDIIIEIKKI